MLTHQEVQQIRQDLQQDGVSDPLLLDDLLDHLCTGIEDQMALGSDFETAYTQLLQQMIPDGAREIQEATTFLLTLNQYIFMRKLLYILAFVWAFVSVMSVLFNLLQLPGTNVLVQTSALLLGVGLIPIFLVYSIRKQQSKGLLEKATYVVGGITGVAVTFASIFKLMHWAGANILLISSLFILAVGFLPLFFVLLYKQGDRQTLAGG